MKRFFLMVRSAVKLRVSNHEGRGVETNVAFILRDAICDRSSG